MTPSDLAAPSANAPVGIFDSGVGGLSVLRHVRTLLPAEHLVYFADTGFSPYGDKPEALIVARALGIAAFLVEHGVKALVVACNTATAAAIEALRARYPLLAVVGVEPGLKPAAAASAGRIVGVLATSATLRSARFAQLQAQVTAATGVTFLLQACPGLADQIERGELRAPATARLVAALVTPLLQHGADTLVLGCTHYPFVTPLIEAVIRRHAAEHTVVLVDTGAAVARQLEAVLCSAAALNHGSGSAGQISAFTSGTRSTTEQAFQRLLGEAVGVTAVASLTAATGAAPLAAI